MQRMSGLDATMLYTETSTAHMHTMKIAVLDVAEVRGAYDRDRLVRELEARIHLLDSFRRRAVRVPFDLHHPVWIEDPDFVVGHHVRERVLPAPGGQEQFEGVLAEIHAEPLDPTRPLWEMTLITGLASGDIAVAAKIHHAVGDGMAAATALAHLASAGPDDQVPPPAAVPDPEPVPGPWRLARGAVADRVRQWLTLTSLVRRTLEGVVRMVRARRGIADRPPAPLSGPRAPWNGPLTRRRSVGTLARPLDEFKVVKDIYGCTLNDVLLGVAAGGLRRYMDRHGGVPDKPLVCAIPTATDPAGAPPRLWGNKTSQFFTSLRTDIADPVDRLRAIHSVTRNAKVLNRELGPELTEAWNEFATPAPYKLLWGRVMPRVRRPPVNVVVSNVPGPRDPIWFAGARMRHFYSLSVLTEGVGLNLTVWSYAGTMYMGLVSCPELVARPVEMLTDMGEALDELRERATRDAELATGPA